MTKNTEVKKERKSGTLIVRMSEREREILDRKISESGAKSGAEYIRDYVINSNPKQKLVISPEVWKFVIAFDQVAMLCAMEIKEGPEKNQIIDALLKMKEQLLPGVRAY